MNVAVIPARGGSKRIPRKNIREFAGTPMGAYSIRRAIESGLFWRVIVSVDGEEIARVTRASGAEVPFVHSENLRRGLAVLDAGDLDHVFSATAASAPLSCVSRGGTFRTSTRRKGWARAESMTACIGNE